jgi:formylglycine-generating enzyme required for sulfatase activity
VKKYLNSIFTFAMLKNSFFPFALVFCSLFAVVCAKAQEMIPIQGGTFTMGCTLAQKSGCDLNGGSCCDWELPNRQVSLSDYSIGKYEVTQGEWKALFGSNPSYFPACGDNCPVEQVSWLDALVYCNRLSESKGYTPCYYTDANFTQIYGKSGSTWSLPNQDITIYWREDANGYYLPTEAQWEYAARGGYKSSNKEFSGSNSIGDVAWYSSNSSSTTHTKGTKTANELGIFDMSGNVWEWCFDTYAGGVYPNTNDCCNPTAPDGTTAHTSAGGSSRVERGGGWGDGATGSRVSIRFYSTPYFRYGGIGFRLCRSQ